MKKTTKKIALALSAMLLIQPLIFAYDSQLSKEITELELEISKMKTKTGDYAKMSEKEIEKKLDKAQKELAKKKEQAKKEAEKDKDAIKKGAKAAGKELKEAGKDIKEAGKEAGKDFKKAGKEIGNAFKDIFD